MKRTQLMIIMTILASILLIELAILTFIIYFATMPFFLFLFTLGLRILSIILLSFVIAFLIFTMLGIRPELTIEWWILHIRELTKKPFMVILLSIGTIIFSFILGAALALLTERLFFLPHMKKLNHWVITHLR